MFLPATKVVKTIACRVVKKDIISCDGTNYRTRLLRDFNGQGHSFLDSFGLFLKKSFLNYKDMGKYPKLNNMEFF